MSAAAGVMNAAGSMVGVYGAAIQGAAQVGTTAIQSALGGDADSGRGRFDLSSFMDGSGWSVSTGSARTSARSTGGGGRTSTEQGNGEGGMLPPGMTQNTLLLIGAGLLAVALVVRRKGS